MSLQEFLTKEAIICNFRPPGKKQLLHEVAVNLSPRVDLPEKIILDALMQRERLGSTGIGNGIAIPHAKFTGLSRLSGLFLRLKSPIDFEALDSMAVDLIFVLLAPEGAGADHLKGLARVARALRDPVRAAKIRTAPDAGTIHALLCEDTASKAA